MRAPQAGAHRTAKRAAGRLTPRMSRDHRARPSVPPRVWGLAGPLALLAPERCLACRVRSPLPWCRRCEAAATVRPRGCRRCGGRRGPGHPCWPAPAPVASTTALYDYRGPVAAAIVAAKLGGARAGWPHLAARLADRVRDDAPAVDAVTWVTTPVRRVRQRGQDHAEVLARTVAAALDLPAVVTVTARADRHGPDRFAPRQALPGTELLLVDDVLTTGRTAAAVVAVLQAAGAGDIHLAVLARAGNHPLLAGG